MLSGLDQALAHEAAGRLREAVAAAKNLLATHPEDAAAHAVMARLALRLGRAEAATDFARTATALDPGHAEGWLQLARALHRNGEAHGARDAMDRARTLAPDDLRILNESGNLALARGDADAAIDAFRRALDAAPGNPVIRCNLGLALGHAGRTGDALATLRSLAGEAAIPPETFDHIAALEAIRGDMAGAETAQAEGIRRFPDRARGHLLMARLKSTLGRADDALGHFRDCLRLDPANAEAAFVLAAMGEGDAPPTPPDGYYAGLFDYYADFFEWHLTEKLGYCGHQLIRDRIAADLGAPAGRLETLDLGCGTGLCAAEVLPWLSAVDGIDIAPKMVANATKRGIYRHLETASALDFLNGRQAAYDLVTAADLLGYIGEPRPLISAVRQALRDGGHFCFTAELGQVESFGMGAHIRYVYNPDFLGSAAREAGFETVSEAVGTMRRDGDEPIRVTVMMLRAKAG
jgi:predicted TPR repeat methyltransferase